MDSCGDWGCGSGACGSELEVGAMGKLWGR